MLVDDLLATFEPWMTDDLQDYLEVVGGMFAQAESVVLYDADALEAAGIDLDDVDDDASYVFLLHPDFCPAICLPYLAQYVGERLPRGLTVQAQRDWIKLRPNSRRGTLPSLAAAASRSLIGNKLVTIVERSDGTSGDHPDDVVISTFDVETPDDAQVLRDIEDTFPLELSLHYQSIPGNSWQNVMTANASWADVAARGSWGEIASGMSGGIVYGH
jgi:hypothetical protein